MNNQKPKIFLSYAREDMGMAKQLYNDLKRYGLDVWLDTESLLPGDRWKDKIQDAIEHSNYFIALLSTRSVNKKGFVQKELKTALKVLDLFPSSERFILPVRSDDCEICERRLKEHHWVDLFPDDEYQNGLKEILKVVCKEALLLRSKPKDLSNTDVSNIILKFDFFDSNKNSESKGIEHKYNLKKIKCDKVVCDEATGLMWQQSGTSAEMKFEDVKKWIIKELNQNRFAGFNDWRLPTLEEVMSLVERKKNKDGLHINPIFGKKQIWIWTSDLFKGESRAVWVVFFHLGLCYWYDFDNDIYVRAVRSGQLYTE